MLLAFSRSNFFLLQPFFFLLQNQILRWDLNSNVPFLRNKNSMTVKFRTLILHDGGFNPNPKKFRFRHSSYNKNILPACVTYRKRRFRINLFSFNIITETVFQSLKFWLCATDSSITWENFSVIDRIAFEKRYIKVRKFLKKGFWTKCNFMVIFNYQEARFSVPFLNAFEWFCALASARLCSA